MLLSAIGKREVPIPEHIDIYHLTREMPPSDKTPLQCVMEVDTERAMLEREAERLAHEDGKASQRPKGRFLHFLPYQRKFGFLGEVFMCCGTCVAQLPCTNGYGDNSLEKLFHVAF